MAPRKQEEWVGPLRPIQRDSNSRTGEWACLLCERAGQYLSVPCCVNCPVLETNDAVPEINAEPDALVNRPVPPENVAGPLNATSGPVLVLVPLHSEKS